MLPLSHDELVHGKGTLLDRMPGDEWQKFANLRLLFAYMYAHPGAKLLFMGSEIAQNIEWNHDDSLQWHLLQNPLHKGVQQLVRDLNHLYKKQPALYENNFEASGFEWIDYSDNENSVLAFVRNGNEPNDQLLVVCNFSSDAISDYKVGVPNKGFWKEILNSDDPKYGGSGFTNGGILKTINRSVHQRKQYLKINLPPLGVSFLKIETDEK
jgi:1,4-alpha-glucan branching enzyme